MDNGVIVGTPSASLMPARGHKFRYISDVAVLVVPIRGEFPEDYNRQGAFDLAPQPGSFLYGTLIEVLFAYKTYPALEDDQRFILSGVEFHEDDNEVLLFGRVVQLLAEEKCQLNKES